MRSVTDNEASSAASALSRRGWLRYGRVDLPLLGAALTQAGVLGFALAIGAAGGLWAKIACALLVAVNTWWGSNTVAHIHLHTPLFRNPKANRAFALFLTIILGVPQTLWRRRHLAHHAGLPGTARRRGIGAPLAQELALVLVTWSLLAWFDLRLFLFCYVPGYIAAMVLCQMQGYYEHSTPNGTEPGGISYYGRFHNWLWFNDGFHAEHHRWPSEHWSRLPARTAALEQAAQSSMAPNMRWLKVLQPRMILNRLQGRLLGALERMVLRIAPLQRFLISRHERAFAALLPSLEGRNLRRITIVGGGLFPRTVLVLRRLLPQADLIVVDGSKHNIDCAIEFLCRHGEEKPVRFEERVFVSDAETDADLVVIPLAYVGNRNALYSGRGSAALIVHDWIWTRQGNNSAIAASAIVSIWVLKRCSLILPLPHEPSP